MIPISDLKKQIAPIRQELDAAIKKIIDNVNFILGKEISDFENEVTKYTNAKYAAGVSSGTDAIKLALIALGIKPGDGVICPAFTYYATAGAVACIGAIPVFADIDPDTYNISSLSVRNILKGKKKLKIKAIVPVHLYGQCADMDSILKIAGQNSLKVVEDAAQAFGAEYRGRYAGTMGDCGAVSFFPGKNLGAFGDAGMVLTNSKIIGEKIRVLRNQGNKEKYNHLVVGYNNRMDTIQAAVLNAKLKYLDSWNRKRQENAAYFNRKFKDFPAKAGSRKMREKIKTPLVSKFTTHIYHQYVLRLNGPSKQLIEHLRNKGIDARVYYPLPLHLQKCFKYLGYKKGDFPESEKASIQTLAIPVYPGLTREELNYIIESIKEFLR
jgi:dTDP-4-amino-4,6-dideoxygalactose transaminase